MPKGSAITHGDIYSGFKRKQRLRILLINNPTASLFMAAWYIQNGYHKDPSCRTVAIYSTIDLDDGYSENIEEKESVYEQVSSRAFKDIVYEWHACKPARYENYYSVDFCRPAEILKKRTDRKADIQRIADFLRERGIEADGVDEIWSGSNVFLPHFRLVCKKALVVSFEHGLSDLRNAVLYNQAMSKGSTDTDRVSNFAFDRLVTIAKSLRRKLDSLLTYYSMDAAMDKHISVFGRELAITNGRLKVECIQPEIVSSLSLSIMRRDPSCSFFTGLEGNSAIILLESIKEYSNERDDNLNFFRHFEGYLMTKWSDLFVKHEIRNIFFKNRFFFEEYTKDAVDNFGKLRERFHIALLSDISPANYAVEYYISLIRPKILMGAYSSGLFYAKKIDAGLETLSYDRWYIDYCNKEFGRAHPDFAWLRPFYESDRMIAFRPFVPRAIEEISLHG